MTAAKVAVVDSGVANLASVMAALKRLSADAEITFDAARIAGAERVIIPGVGAAAPAMAQIRNKGLRDVLRGLTRPVLGFCLGMQLLFDRSFEGDAPVECLSILPGDIKLLKTGPDQPVPHMGWNEIVPVKPGHPLLRGVASGSYVYFVHSYAANVSDTTIATTDYGAPFASMAHQRNFFGCQFHPEKSGAVGAKIIENFLAI